MPVPPASRLAGNLVGPVAYTGVEWLMEGPAFFAHPDHLAYRCFAAAVGLLQWGARAAPPRLRPARAAN